MVFDFKAQADIFVIALGGIILMGVIFGVFLVNAPNFIEQPQESKLQKFSSYDEMVAYFEKARNTAYGGWGDFALPMMANSIGKTSDSARVMEESVAQSSDYSTTNIQVEGVDEADIVKNDGKYIYAIAQNKLFIIDAFPAEGMNKIATIDFNLQSPIELFISKNSNRLIVFTNGYSNYNYYYSYEKSVPFDERVTQPYWNVTSFVSANIYDITNKANPVLVKTIDLEGSYLSSRLIGEKAYFVINTYPNFYYPMRPYPVAMDAAPSRPAGPMTDENNIIPLIRIDGREDRVAKVNEIGIMPRVVPESFITIASIDLQNLELIKETVVGSARNLYSSQDNLYLAEQSWEYSDYNGPIPLEAGLIVKSLYFPNLTTTEKTIISKFHLSDGKISYAGQGVAPGHILNQFSMDEFNNNFRIATTVGNSWGEGENASKNNLYVFNNDMNLVGVLEELAPGETIYSVRFMGERAYMVTFKKVDPLFVIDVANPTNPQVLGKLKIPGYSDYLHPIDSTHIIGIGKDAIESSYGTFAWYQGMKMAIFDVTDVANPKEMHKIVIGDRGTDSEALNDHKAFLYNKEKKLLVIPVDLAEILDKNINPAMERESPTYGEHTFQGAMVFEVTLENGFKEKGRITHVSAEEEMKRGYYYDYQSRIRRSLYMDNVLYTLSEKMIKATQLVTSDNKILGPSNELIAIAQIKDLLFVENINCEEYTYSNCPTDCTARCISSGANTADCDGTGSCAAN